MGSQVRYEKWKVLFSILMPSHPYSNAPFRTHPDIITEQTKQFAFQLRLCYTALAEEQARSFVDRALSYQNSNFLLLT